MVKKLRYKFVLVTMSLLIIIFCVLSIADYYNTKYWQTFDTLEVLEWMASSKSFAENPLFEQMGNDYNPIYIAKMDKTGAILDVQSTTGHLENAAIRTVLASLYNNDFDGYTFDSFIFTSKAMDDGNTLIILTDQDAYKASPLRILGSCAIIALGIFLLFGVCVYLSRFVTEPAKNALEREKQFVSDASHELKTPLAAISINAQVLQRQYGDNKNLDHILSETKRMNKLIYRLLKLSRLEENEQSIEKNVFSLSSCCEEMVLTLESLAYENYIELEYEIEENISYNGNEDEIRQLVSILLDNAIKHTPEKGMISLSLSKKTGHPVLAVTNDGKAIPQEDLPYIFDRFYRSEKSRANKDDSFGLGLAIAKAIVDFHGGTISVKSIPEKSTCFTVVL